MMSLQLRVLEPEGGYLRDCAMKKTNALQRTAVVNGGTVSTLSVPERQCSCLLGLTPTIS